jgi:manganese-dependent inorganic pyrophosphatase
MLDALERLRQRNGYLFAALMVTDIVEGGTDLLCVGDCDPVERVFDKQARENVIDLPGVMSRKKQVAPKLLAAF